MATPAKGAKLSAKCPTVFHGNDPVGALLAERFRQTFQVLRTDVYQAMTWSIDIGDQHKGNRDDQWQHEGKL